MTEPSLDSSKPSFFSNFGFHDDILSLFSKAPSSSKAMSPEPQSLTTFYSTCDDDVLSESPTTPSSIFLCSKLSSVFSTLTHTPNNSSPKNVIRAYKSKLKTKFKDIYENNSKTYLDNTKYKIYHKCCHPHCGRTFSSAGWLKAHFDEHLREKSLHEFNKLFNKYVNDIC